MIIAFAGKQLSGKSTTAAMLAREMRIGVLDTSDYLIRRLVAGTGLSVDYIKKNKSKWRQELTELSSEIEAKSPASLVLNLIEGQAVGIVDSVRRKSEVEVLREKGALIILVECPREIRERRGPLACEEDPTEYEAIEELKRVGDYYPICNAGSLELLQNEVYSLLELII